LIEGIGYVYEFSFDRRGLTHEILKTQPKSERLVFERTRLDDSSYSIKQGSRYSGISSRLKGYNDNGPVLGLLAKFGINDCKTVYSWIQDKLVVADYSRNIDEIIIIEKLKALDSQGFSKAIDAVRAADLGIAGAQLVVTDLTAEERENQKVVAEQFKKIYELLTGEQVEEFSPDLTKTTLQFQHVIAGAKRGLGLKDESLGTVTMLNLAIDFIDAVANGKTLVIDEADRSLHPVLLRSLLRLFCDCDSNPLGAQLVLTTHDLLIMDGDLLRRDQFWFVQKSAESGASELYPLSDYSPRKDDNLLNRYLYGAYGAVPYIEEVF
jgi:hypothetical protein